MSRPSYEQCQLGLITAGFRSNFIIRSALHSTARIGFDSVVFGRKLLTFLSCDCGIEKRAQRVRFFFSSECEQTLKS